MEAKQPPDRKLDVFYGISSPWAYLGAERAYAIADRHSAGLRLRPIRVITENGGIMLRTRPDARQAYHEVELDRWRRFLGVPLNLRPRFYPCRTIEPAAQTVIALAQAGFDVREVSLGIQRALWAEERDIADTGTLRQIAQHALGAKAAALVRDPYGPDVLAKWHGNLAEATRLGIFGTPTYVVDGELFWGQDRLDFVDRALGQVSSRGSK